MVQGLLKILFIRKVPGECFLFFILNFVELHFVFKLKHKSQNKSNVQSNVIHGHLIQILRFRIDFQWQYITAKLQ